MSKIELVSNMDDVVKFISNHDMTKVGSWNKDENGQLIFHSNIYEWKDGTFHTEQESA